MQCSSKWAPACLLQAKKDADAQSCEMNAWFLLLKWTVNANPTKFMNHIWDQADGPCPKSWLHQFHREEVFTGQWVQMSRWEDCGCPHTPPSTNPTGWAFPGMLRARRVRQPFFPACPWALSWKASSLNIRFWDLFNLSAAERIFDKGAYSLQTVRASSMGCQATGARLVIGENKNTWKLLFS